MLDPRYRESRIEYRESKSVMPEAFLGIGSNLGDRQKNIDEALNLLRENNIEIIKMSTVIETEAVGGPKQGKFFNAVAKIKTTKMPAQLLELLMKIENQLGRVRTEKNAARTIDLDILLYGNRKINTERLIVPHPRMLQRDFVLIPLNEIEPLWATLLPS